MSNHKIIGISGVTCAGKTTLAERLRSYFGPKCVLLSQDLFYRLEEDPNHEWIEINGGIKHQNWESMSSIDWQTFTKTITQTLDNWDYQSHHQLVVLIEGHLIFNYRPISELCVKKYFLTLNKDECIERRNARTYLPKDPDGYFQEWVWPLYLKNLNQMKEIQNHIPIEYLDASCDQNILFDTVVKSLEQLDQ